MVCFGKIDTKSIYPVLNHYGLALHQVAKRSEIPYSFWGSPEAGRRKNQLYVCFDTPVHSILHETCHFICMPKMRRFLDNIDAAGDIMEENSTCYLQILLSDHIEGFHRTLHMADMDD